MPCKGLQRAFASYVSHIRYLEAQEGLPATPVELLRDRFESEAHRAWLRGEQVHRAYRPDPTEQEQVVHHYHHREPRVLPPLRATKPHIEEYF